MRKRYILVAVALVLTALVAWDVLAPGRTVAAMIKAAKANDAATLAAHVDFPALKSDVKADLTSRIEAEAKGNKDPAAQMGAAIARSMIDGIANAFASPDGIRATFAVLDDADAPPEAKQQNGKMKIERTGLNSFRVAREKMPGSGFVFERRGLGWKLAGVDLPPSPPRQPQGPAR